MQRVLVMGCSGSGKTTLGRALADRIGVPFVSLDQLFWRPGWQPSEKAVFDKIVTREAEQAAWVIDGSYLSHGGEIRRSRADTVIWFDLPRWICVYRVLARTVRTYGKVRPEMAPGCPERFDLDFFRYVWTFPAVQRPKLMTYFAGLRDDQRLITIRRNADARAVLAMAGAV